MDAAAYDVQMVSWGEDEGLPLSLWSMQYMSAVGFRWDNTVVDCILHMHEKHHTAAVTIRLQTYRATYLEHRREGSLP